MPGFSTGLSPVSYTHLDVYKRQALALEDVGPQAVQDKIGADPTGLPFNSVIALELHGGKPLSPLVNAGAIATTSLINAENAEQRWQRILHIQQQLAGEQLSLIHI